MAQRREGPPTYSQQLAQVHEQRDIAGNDAKNLTIRTLNAKLDTLPNYNGHSWGYIVDGKPGVVLVEGGYDGHWTWNPMVILDQTEIYEIPWDKNFGHRNLDHENKKEVNSTKYQDLVEVAIREIDVWADRLQQRRQV